MKNTILILLLLLLLLLLSAACNDKESPEIEIPQVELHSEEGIRLLKQYALEADSVIQIHRDAFLNHNKPFNIYHISTDIRALDAVKVTTPDGITSAFSIFIEYKNGLYMDYLVISKDDELLVEDEKRDNYDCGRTWIEEPNTPLGKKAVILAPFQKDFEEDFTFIKKCLTDVGFDVEIYTNEEVTTDFYKGSFLKNYDVIYITTHSSYSGILSGIEISEETINRPEVFPVALKGKVYEGAIPLNDSTDNPFPNSLVYLDADNFFLGVFSLFTDEHQAGCYIANSRKINVNTAKETANLVFKYLSEGMDIESVEIRICEELSKPYLNAALRDNTKSFYLVAPAKE